VMAAAIFNFMPEQWHERIHSIANYQEDASSMGRINAWQFAINLASDRPLVGGGFETFRPYFFQQYAPNPLVFADAHSIYFEVLGEHGFVGLFLFLLIGLLTYQTAKKCVKRTRGIAELRSINNLMRMVQVSIIGYAVSGAFLGLAYFDLYYHLVAFVVISKGIVNEHFSNNKVKEQEKHGLLSSG